ncbi:MAG: hypothetical protein ABSG35_10740 [Syntrophobacteraceae bacterium]|jgi:hypothetical protein
MLTDKDGNIVSMTMVDGKGCELHKTEKIILGFCSRCPREKIKTICPMDILVMREHLMEELGMVEYEEIPGDQGD